MKRIKRFLSVLLIIVTTAFGVAIALGNAETIALRFVFWETWSLPVFVWIIIAYVLGLGTSALVMLISRIRTRSIE